jgi:hypothetical protein
MFVREIYNRGGVRTERLVDYSTGEVVSARPPRERAADPWTNHYDLAIGARTKEHAKEIAKKCAAAGLTATFDKQLNLKCDSERHRRKLCDAIFGKGKIINRDSFY